MLIRVTGPNFVAGLILGNNGRVAEAAPVVKWAQCMTVDQVHAEAAKRGPEAKTVHTLRGAGIKAGKSWAAARRAHVAERHRQAVRVLGFYSITSSARASSIGGTSRPSALAILRLTARPP